MINTKNNISNWKPEVLVMTGGGLKGIGIIGALTALRDKGVKLSDIKVVCGSSVGGIIATCIILGYKMEVLRCELEKAGDMIPDAIPALFKKERHYKIIPLLLERFSISDGKIWDEEMKSIFTNKGYDPMRLTFRKLRKLFKKDLVLSGSNITTGMPEYFSYRHTPNMLVYDAVRITSRIPFILPVIRRNNSVVVDGDLFDAFPIKGAKKKIIKKANKGDMIGFAITPADKSYQINTISDYFTQLLMGLSIRHNRMCYESYSKYLIYIHGDRATGINISKSDRSDLYTQGYNAGVKYLERRGLPITPYQTDEQQKKLSEDLVQIDKEEHLDRHEEEQLD